MYPWIKHGDGKKHDTKEELKQAGCTNWKIQMNVAFEARHQIPLAVKENLVYSLLYSVPLSLLLLAARSVWLF